MLEKNSGDKESVAMTEEQYEQLRDELKQDVISEVRAEIRDELAATNEVEVRGEDDNAGLSDIWIAGNPVGTLLDKALQNSSEAKELAEARSLDHNPEGEGRENSSSDDDMLPIERLMKLKEQDDDHPALPSNGRESFERAVSIFEHYEEWSNKTPKGRTITDGIRTLLETATGEKLAWRQVYRAMDKVELWTRGAITHETTNRHGHVLVMSGRPSSAGAGG